MAKRGFDLLVSAVLFALTIPLFPIIAVSILLSDGPPILYLATRIGHKGTPFKMHKFRTMRNRSGAGSRVTSGQDARIFFVGMILRRTKLDELPQLWDVVRGKMSIVGPRPEDRSIVEEHYQESWYETLDVKPGLTSPGSLYYYTLVEDVIPGDDPETHYLQNVLPVKIEVDRYYVKNASICYDIEVCIRTLFVILARIVGKRKFNDVRELRHVRSYMGWDNYESR